MFILLLNLLVTPFQALAASPLLSAPTLPTGTCLLDRVPATEHTSPSSPHPTFGTLLPVC